MKNSFLLAGLLLIAGWSCRKSSGSEAELAGQLESSTWAIHYYYNGADSTALFSNWKFSFQNSAVLQASISNTNQTGTWGTSTGTGGALQLQIQFNGQVPLGRLNGNWKIFNNDGTLLQLTELGAALPRTLHFIRQ